MKDSEKRSGDCRLPGDRLSPSTMMVTTALTSWFSSGLCLDNPNLRKSRFLSLQPESAATVEVKRFSRAEPLSSNWQPRNSTVRNSTMRISKMTYNQTYKFEAPQRTSTIENHTAGGRPSRMSRFENHSRSSKTQRRSTSRKNTIPNVNIEQSIQMINEQIKLIETQQNKNDLLEAINSVTSTSNPIHV